MKRLFAGKEILIKIIIDVSIYIFIALLFRILHENTPSADCLDSPLRSLICGRGRGVPRCERSEQWGFRRGKGVWGLARFIAPEGWETPKGGAAAQNVAGGNTSILNSPFSILN